MLRFLLKAILLVGSTVGILAGCSARYWYNYAAGNAKAECERKAPPERPDCLATVNNRTYDEYEKERSKQ